MREVTEEELDAAMAEHDSDEMCERIGAANTIQEYDARQAALREVAREATRRAINRVIKLREQ